jgi:hypothetical protein
MVVEPRVVGSTFSLVFTGNREVVVILVELFIKI